MKSNLLFEFIVDRERNELTVIREFAAGRSLVWDCYTKSELLDQWFAPKPFTTKTKSMDFSEGGHWHYAMIDPEGAEYWGMVGFLTIDPTVKYTSTDAFSNEAGETNKDLPVGFWVADFADSGSNTIVETKVKYESLEDLETVVKMGMEEGMKLTLEKLDDLLLILNP